MSATYQELLLDVRRRLKQKGISMAELESRILVSRACGKSRDELIRDGQLYVNSERIDAVEQLVSRRLNDEPLAYILGEWSFMGHTIEVTHDTLIPRSDTELLCEQAVACLGEGGLLLDLCCGTGCIGLCSLAESQNSRAVLCELSQPALAVAKRNARRLGVTARAFFVCLNALMPLPKALGNFDVIVSNPPYIPSKDIATLDRSVREYEPEIALDGGEDGLDFYRAFAQNLKANLNKKGTALFEIGAGEAAAVTELFRSEGWSHIEVLNDLSGIERVVKCRLD